MPEISRRVLWALEVSGDRAVLLSGHSQGSLIVTTVAARMPRLDRIRMITYGSQVRALYGRFFPAVFGPDVVGYAPTTGAMLLGRPEPDLRTAVSGAPAAPAGTLRARFAAVGPLGQPVPPYRPAGLPGLLRPGLRARRADPRGAARATWATPARRSRGTATTSTHRSTAGSVRDWTHEPYVDHPTAPPTCCRCRLPELGSAQAERAVDLQRSARAIAGQLNDSWARTPAGAPARRAPARGRRRRRRARRRGRRRSAPGRAGCRCRRWPARSAPASRSRRGTTTSGMPPVAVATTAVSQAIASRLTMPSGS